MFETAAILLAAGQSRRMGTQNKLLLPVAGVPMVRHVVDQIAAAIDGPVLVVLGHQAESITAALDGSSAETVFNPQFAAGQFTSVASGLRHADDAEMLLIGLSDLPLLRARDIQTLIDAHRSANTGKISIPVNGTKRGNPIVVPRCLRARLLEDPKNPGCQKFTRLHPELVQEMTLTAKGFYVDIDTSDTYKTYFPETQENMN